MAKVLLEDTRQHKDKHEHKREWWSRNGFALVRSKIAFGDYCLPPEVAVDTKASIAELAYDIDQEHARFRRELVGARDAGCKLYVLVENDDGVTSLSDLAGWMESQEDFAQRVQAKRRLKGDRLAKACATMEERYGATFLFCAPEEAARMVSELLGVEHGKS
jgi:ribosome-associated protein